MEELLKEITGSVFLDIIKARRSCRKYKAEQIEDEKLEAVLEAGTYAPTSRGLQSPFIVAVQAPVMLRKLAAMNAKILGTSSNPYYDAPTYILVFAPADAPNPVQDGSLVLGHMMLAAQAVGLGSCWIHREREMFDTPEGRELMKEWNLPDGLMGIGALAIGYPEPEDHPVVPRKKGYIRLVKPGLPGLEESLPDYEDLTDLDEVLGDLEEDK